jgi:hypothetical protein
MTKNMYIQPSVNVTEMEMVQALCVSGGGNTPDPGVPLSTFTGATTDIQL